MLDEILRYGQTFDLVPHVIALYVLELLIG
jgi:hypothetical protein